MHDLPANDTSLVHSSACASFKASFKAYLQTCFLALQLKDEFICVYQGGKPAGKDETKMVAEITVLERECRGRWHLVAEDILVPGNNISFADAEQYAKSVSASQVG